MRACRYAYLFAVLLVANLLHDLHHLMPRITLCSVSLCSQLISLVILKVI